MEGVMEVTNVKKYNFEPEKRKLVRKIYAGILKLRKRALGKKNEFDYYFSEPVVDKTIFISGLGRSVRGSMQYLLNELNSNDLYKDYTIYVRTAKSTDAVVREYIEKNGWTRTQAVSKGFAQYMESCKYLITESYFPYSWIRRPGQVMIDLWHGTPLKRLGVLKSGDKCHKTAIQQKNFLSADYLLYPNDFTRDVMWRSYGITSLLSAKALMMGYPRTAGILKAAETMDENVVRQLAPNGEHIYAYMPTFRGHLSDEEAIARETDFLDYVDAHLRDDQILYVNLHHHIKEGLDVSGYKHIRLFPPLLDSYVLLAASEALISDYSSVFFDYLVLKKHIILYIEDIDSYLEHHGLNLDIESLPFDLARDRESVISMLNAGKQYDDSGYFEAMCGHDAADNPEKFCKLFLGDEDGLAISEIPDNDNLKVLLYTDYCSTGKDTDRLVAINEAYERDKAEIYIGVDEFKTDDNMGGAYPFLHNALVLTSRDDNTLSSVGSPVLKMYKDGKMSFKAAMRLLQFEYALIPKRMYGYADAAFDVLAAYDTVNPEIILAYALSEAKNKALFISDRVEKALNDGDKFLRDAIRYAAPYYAAIVTSDSGKRQLIEGIIKGSDRAKLTTVETAADVIQFLEDINK